MEDEEREALRDEGLDPDDPTVVGAMTLVRLELSLLSDATRTTDTEAASTDVNAVAP